MSTEINPIEIPLNRICFDESYYPRLGGISWPDVERYRDAMRVNGAESFPPLTVVSAGGDGGMYYALDGRHRHEAARRLHLDSFRCVVEDIPRKTWPLRAAELNIRHGRALTYQDRIAVADRLKRNGFALKQISKVLGIDYTRLTDALGRVVMGDDGSIVLKGALCHLAGTAHERDACKHQSAIANANGRRIAAEFLAMLQAHGFDLDDADVLGKLKKIEEILKAMRL
jgi:hypothetical protein